MTDPRHVSDTLFFVLEEDWRLTKEDGFSQAELLEEQRRRGAQMAVSSSPSQPHQANSSLQLTPSPEAAHSTALRRDWLRITESVGQDSEQGRMGQRPQAAPSAVLANPHVEAD